MKKDRKYVVLAALAVWALVAGDASAGERCNSGDYNCLLVAAQPVPTEVTRCGVAKPLDTMEVIRVPARETRMVPVTTTQYVEVPAAQGLDNAVVINWADELKAEVAIERAKLERARATAYREVERLRDEYKRVQKHREYLRKTLNGLAQDLR